MAELGFNVGQTLAESAKGMQEFQETVAAPQALKQAFAGMSAEDRQDPQKQMAALMQAGTSLMSQGKGKAGYEMLKEASALKTASQTQQLNEMKVKTEQLDYAGQLMQGAQTEDDLRGVIDSVVTDPAAKLHVESIMKNPNVTFEQKKKSLVDMSMTAKENLTSQLNASKAALDAANKESQIEKRKTDEMAKERDQALAREKEARQAKEQDFRDKEKLKSDNLAERRLTVSERLAAASERRAAAAEAKAAGDVGDSGKVYNTLKEKLDDPDYGVATKKVPAREQTIARRINTDANEVTQGLDQVMHLTKGGMKDVSGTMFANVKDDGILKATFKSFVTPITPKESQMYDAMMYPLVQGIALFTKPDYRPTVSDVQNAEKSYKATANQPHVVQLEKLAELKKNFISSAESYLDSGIMNKQQAANIKKQIKAVQNYIPWDVNDVTDFTRQKGEKDFEKYLSSKGKPVGSSRTQTSLPKTESDKANEKAAAEAAKYGL